MSLVQLIALAVVQGFTEFLPISSSGHLILLPAFFSWPDQGLGFDIAVHLGTLTAVVVYFRRDVSGMARSLLTPQRTEFRMAWQIFAASIPFGLAGLLLSSYAEPLLRSPWIIAVASAGFGLLLWAADRLWRGARSERSLGWLEALLIGSSQAFALIPGTSRSGITMTVALAMGLSREAAGRFSFLLAIPAIGMAGVWQAVQFAAEPQDVLWGSLALAMLISAVTAFVTIALFLKLIGRIGMGVFALYRVLLAALIVYVLV